MVMKYLEIGWKLSALKNGQGSCLCSSRIMQCQVGGIGARSTQALQRRMFYRTTLDWNCSTEGRYKMLSVQHARSADHSAQKGKQKSGKQVESVYGDHVPRSFCVFVGNYFNSSDSLPERIKTPQTTQVSAMVAQNNALRLLSYLKLYSRKHAFSQFPWEQTLSIWASTTIHFWHAFEVDMYSSFRDRKSNAESSSVLPTAGWWISAKPEDESRVADSIHLLWQDGALSDGCSLFSCCLQLKIGSEGSILNSVVPPYFLSVMTYSCLPKSTSVTFSIFLEADLFSFFFFFFSFKLEIGIGIEI